jgi:hypothetical protein
MSETFEILREDYDALTNIIETPPTSIIYHSNTCLRENIRILKDIKTRYPMIKDIDELIELHESKIQTNNIVEEGLKNFEKTKKHTIMPNGVVMTYIP